MIELPAVTLRGGLGNQLFQLAFQLSSRPVGNIYLDVSSAYSQKSAQIDLLKFVLPTRVKICENSKLGSRISRTINSRLLRMGLLVYKKNYLILVLRFIEFLTSIYYSIYLRTLIIFRVAIGNGYDKRITLSNSRRCLNIGFFQSYRWVLDGSVRDEIFHLRLDEPSEELLSLIKLAQVVKPLIVHIRLGDYLNDLSRGIPDKIYYNSGIQLLVKDHQPKEIWIFSDDELFAREYLRLEYPNLRWFSKVNNSDVETFELMRHGSSYLIGNSTFSWWAATLSYSLHPEVIAPSPWFIASPIPQDLLWENWKTLPAWDK